MIRVAIATATGGIVGAVSLQPVIVRHVARFLADTPLDGALDPAGVSFSIGVTLTAMALGAMSEGILYGRERAVKVEAEAVRRVTATQNRQRLRVEALAAEVADRHADVERREASADEREQGLMQYEADVQQRGADADRGMRALELVNLQAAALSSWTQADAERKALDEERTALVGDRIALDAAIIVQHSRDGAEVVDELARGSQFVGQFKRIDIPAATRWYDTKAGKMVSAETVRKATA